MKKYIDISDFPLCISLSENYTKIRKEFQELIAAGYIGKKSNNIMGQQQQESNGKILYSGQIQSSFIRIADESCSLQELNAIYGSSIKSRENALARYKIKQGITLTLERCLAPYMQYIGSVGFNIIYPGGTLNQHYGMCNDYVRIHMGIDCDPEAVFYLENLPPRAWESAKLFAFSDGEAFHGTKHTGENPRSILIVDVKKTAFLNLKEEIWP